MLRPSIALVCLFAAAPLPFLGTSNTYSITVTPDEATKGDLAMLGSAVLATADGDASQSLRKLAAGVMGELRILASERIADGLLTLDDGSAVALAEGDIIALDAACDIETPECGSRPGATIYYSKDGHRPWGIAIRAGNGCVRMIDFHAGGKPTIMTKCGEK